MEVKRQRKTLLKKPKFINYLIVSRYKNSRFSYTKVLNKMRKCIRQKYSSGPKQAKTFINYKQFLGCSKIDTSLVLKQQNICYVNASHSTERDPNLFLSSHDIMTITSKKLVRFVISLGISEFYYIKIIHKNRFV